MIGEIFGDKVKTKIAMRRTDFMTGIVNSYTRILNGPAQLDTISTYTDLAASLSEYHSEVQGQKAIVEAKKQKGVVEKAAKKVLKDTQVTQQCLLLLPICTHHVSGGLTYCLTLTSSISMNPKRERHGQLNFLQKRLLLKILLMHEYKSCFPSL